MKYYFVSAIIVLLAACNRNSSNSVDKKPQSGISYFASPESDKTAPEAAQGSKEEATYYRASTNNDRIANPKESNFVAEKPQNQIIIRSGDISFETGNVHKSHDKILEIAKKLNGYINTDEVQQQDNRLEYTMIIRVEAAKFDDLLNNTREIADKIENQNIKADDVTEEFVDVQARLKAKKQLEQRYTEILKSASTVQDILNIEQQIGSVRAEIESMEGRLKYLTDRAALSTLTLHFYEKTAGSFGFGSKFGRAISGGWQGILWFILGIISLWPLWIILIALFYIIKRYRRRRKTNANSQQS